MTRTLQKKAGQAVRSVPMPELRTSGAECAFIDNRPASGVQRKLRTTIENGAPMIAQRKEMAVLHGEPAQRKSEINSREVKSATTQRMADDQGVLHEGFDGLATNTVQKQGVSNGNGLPGQLKAGIESLSGMDMSSVRVHTNSEKPAQLNALAYAQGNDIHLGPGQERHLPHEAWHVVQQRQGRVRPTMQAKGMAINDDSGLESEADTMGTKALGAGRSAIPPLLRRDQSGQTEATGQRKAVSVQGNERAHISVSPVVQAKRIEKTYEESSRAQEVYSGNEWVYRHMIMQSVQEYFRHFVKEEWELKKEEKEVALSYQGYEEAVADLARESNEGGSVTDERNGRVAAAWLKAVLSLDALRWNLMSKDEKWTELERMPNILYGDPPLTETKAREVLTLLEQGRASGIGALKSNGADFKFNESDRTREWGLLKDGGGRDECKLVVGDATGVSWPKELLDCGIPLAHSHPYFKTGKTRNRYGGIATDTKEIAEHEGLPPGFLQWEKISERKGDGISNEISKIFPSASDIEFSGKQHVAAHTVYTPYAVLTHPQLKKCIANPDIGMTGINNAPRLVFTIINAELAGDGVNYKCTLQAQEGTSVFWSKEVTTSGLGQFGLLKWT